MVHDGVIKTQRRRNAAPPIHPASTLTDQASDLSAKLLPGHREGTRRDNDEATHDPVLMANHACNRLIRAIEHQRAQSRAIRANSPPWIGSMNRNVHRIVTKRERQGFQEFPACGGIGINNGFVYHAPIMLTATKQPRVPDILSATPGLLLISASQAIFEILTRAKRSADFGPVGPVGLAGLVGLVA